MNNNLNNALDPVAFELLLLLSGGQKLSVLDLVRLTGRTADVIWQALLTLKNRKYVDDLKGRYHIISGGVEYLTWRGISASESEDDPKPKDFIKQIRPPFFSSWLELFIWISPPLILLIFAVFAMSKITDGYNFISTDKKVYLGLIISAYVAMFFLYMKFSHHNIVESERLVVFRGGKAIAQKGPGHAFILPLIDNPKKVDMREKSKEINKEPCLTNDNILMNAGFYISWQIDDPILSLTKVTNVEESMTLLATAMLRSAISEYTMENALKMRKAMNNLIRNRIEQKAGDWGVKINNTDIRELHPPEDVMRSIENRFMARLEKRAAVTKADAKIESLQKLFQIGSRMDERTFNLKYLETLEKIGEGASTKYIFPMEFFTLLQNFLQTQINQNNHSKSGNEDNPSGQLPTGSFQ